MTAIRRGLAAVLDYIASGFGWAAGKMRPAQGGGGGPKEPL